MNYLVKIRFQQEQEGGGLKAKSELYLVNAFSFTDAELTAITENRGKKDLKVRQIKEYPVSDIFRKDDTEDDSYIWFKAKVAYITFDEKSQKEKRTNHYILVLSDSVQNAYSLLKSKLGVLNDYEIVDLVTTKIVGII